MGFFELLRGRFKSPTSQPEPDLTNEYLAEIDSLSRVEILDRSLQAAREYKYQALPKRVSTWLAVFDERAYDPPMNDDEVEQTTRLIVDTTFEMYQYAGSFDPWFVGIVGGLPPAVLEAVIRSVELKLAEGEAESCHFKLIRCIGGDRAAAFFEKRRSDSIAQEIAKRGSSWSMLEAKLQHLQIVDLSDAEKFLKNEAQAEGITQYRADSRGWSVGHALHMFNVEDVLLRAVARTAANNGNFAQMANDAEARNRPLPHLAAPHSWWQADDAYGVDTFYALRVGDDEYLCIDRECYG